jgi:hypothetical protein
MLRTVAVHNAFVMVCLFGAATLCSNAQQTTSPQQPISAQTPDPRTEDYKLFGKKTKTTVGPREVLGQVIDPSSTPVAGAVVRLKKVGGEQTRELVSDKNGKFLFDGLSRTEDYVLTASVKGKKPVERRISQFDSRNRIQLMLQLAPDAKTAGTEEAKSSTETK